MSLLCRAKDEMRGKEEETKKPRGRDEKTDRTKTFLDRWKDR